MTPVPNNAPLPHPAADQISLPEVMTALGDQTRLAIIGSLARAEAGLCCGQFTELAGKTAISYHVAKLREAGVVNVTPEGTRRRVTLRRADLDARFPGFLDSIIASTRHLSIDVPSEDLS
jgi:DNA-binding transcriptional ArsR family regulator